MLVHAIMPASRVNGPGLRCVVFVQGCTLDCPSCWNKLSHAFHGTEFAVEAIQAELVIDWSGGTAAPFTSSDASGITLDVHNTGIGLRHQIQIGSQIIDLTGLSSDPMIAPNSTGSPTLFSIGHATSFTSESFNTYDAFITQLQSELTGGTLATGMTAVGQYTVSTFAFSATSITLFLNN